jgi:hypothetical protein
MEKIEGYLESRPILKWLSGDPLPITNRPMSFGRSHHSGVITGECRTGLTPNSWLQTDHIQFLFAFLLRNPETRSGLFYVVPPTIMQSVHDVYKVMPRIVDGTADDGAQLAYRQAIDLIVKHLDQNLDILEHRFLVLVVNHGDMHWESFVVINPFLVYDHYLTKGLQALDEEDDMVGWCLFNSNPHPMDRQDRDGYKGTFHSKNNAKFGMRLFLNICASFLKAKKDNDGDASDLSTFQYDEPFGHFKDVKGTEDFPRFDYSEQCPSIIAQSNGYDCGLAVVANSMGFIKHLKDTKFRKSDMMKHVSENKGCCYLFDIKMHSLKPFWCRVMDDAGKTRHEEVTNSTELLRFM